MPEFSSEMAGVVTGETIPRAIPGAIVETEGMPTGFMWRGLSEVLIDSVVLKVLVIYS
jgi:hypothetical protein